MIIGKEIDNQRALFEGPLGAYMHDLMKQFSAPFFWQSKRTGKWEVESGGSCFFLEGEDHPIMVTAAHVYHGYVRARKARFDVSPSIRNIEIDLERRLISDGTTRNLDIATFQITAAELRAIGCITISKPCGGWPPPRVREGERVMFGGYPAALRISDERGVHSGAYTWSQDVTSVSERGFSFLLRRTNSVVVAQGKIELEEGTDLGGISGCPAVTFEESQAGVVSWRPAGLVFTSNFAFGEIVQSLHIDYILPDGEIHSAL